MSLRYILMAAVAAAALPGVALANDYYRCNDRLCHDDQADETRRLNQMQLENPGAGLDAVPGHANDRGGPYYESPDEADGPPPEADDYPNDDNYGPSPDDDRSDDRSDEPYDDERDRRPISRRRPLSFSARAPRVPTPL